MRSQRSEPWGHLGTQICGLALVLGIVGGWIVWNSSAADWQLIRPNRTGFT